MEGEESEESRGGKVMEGVASIALLPSGSISGHFIQLPNSLCLGLCGTELACERECSRGEDYRLIRLTVIDFNSGREKDMVVECRGHDAARMCNVDHAHWWEKDVVCMLEPKEGNYKVIISFECETLKADEAAEDHIKKFMPKLAGIDAVVNIGWIKMFGLDFDAEAEEQQRATLEVVRLLAQKTKEVGFEFLNTMLLNAHEEMNNSLGFGYADEDGCILT
ncbi:uncharacterized protein [Coffea arabica]|uniref:Uncharacterized protein n=2 Tax=Coffea TaxID=13442 RepID=A0A6P6W450_COFAR